MRGPLPRIRVISAASAGRADRRHRQRQGDRPRRRRELPASAYASSAETSAGTPLRRGSRRRGPTGAARGAGAAGRTGRGAAAGPTRGARPAGRRASPTASWPTPPGSERGAGARQPVGRCDGRGGGSTRGAPTPANAPASGTAARTRPLGAQRPQAQRGRRGRASGVSAVRAVGPRRAAVRWRGRAAAGCPGRTGCRRPWPAACGRLDLRAAALVPAGARVLRCPSRFRRYRPGRGGAPDGTARCAECHTTKGSAAGVAVFGRRVGITTRPQPVRTGRPRRITSTGSRKVAGSLRGSAR